MMLIQPIWLLLVFPLTVWMYLHRDNPFWVKVFRIVCLAAVILALCEPAAVLPSRGGGVTVVADRSDSMPSGYDPVEAVSLVQGGGRGDSLLGVVAFGQQPLVERAPQQGLFKSFQAEVEGDGSNLHDALDRAIDLLPRNGAGRILVLSDGEWTGLDPERAAARAAARNIAVDYRHYRRNVSGDLAIAEISGPDWMVPGEAFVIDAWIEVPFDGEVGYELRRGDVVVKTGRRMMPAGRNRLSFRDLAIAPGTQEYQLILNRDQDDPRPANNRASLLVGVKGAKPVLCLTGDRSSSFAALLAAGGISVEALTPDQFQWSLGFLSRYSAVILENVPAGSIGNEGMGLLEKWVAETGAGLMMTGGQNSYGPGGYYRSPLEPILPVSMELRQEHRKLSLGMVVVLDRSGSMGAPVAGNRTKMDLANLATAEVIGLLSEMDEVGVIAVDSAPHTVVNLTKVKEKNLLRQRALSIDSAGGGIYVFEALTAAADMLLKSEAGTRHILLFADAADAEQPGNYRELLAHCRGAGITVSVVGLGEESDKDAELLKDIALRGGGRAYFSSDAQTLPQLFSQDTFVVARSTFIEEQTRVRFGPEIATVTGRGFPQPPDLGGYNLCYLQDEALLGMISQDENEAPIVAAWQVGTGRVLCYTGEASGAFVGPIAGWSELGAFFSSLVKWTTGDTGIFPSDMVLTQRFRNGVAEIRLHLDPERTDTPALPEVALLRAEAGRSPLLERRRMMWETADRMVLHAALTGEETLLATVQLGERGTYALPPVKQPYSPEFQPLTAAKGRTALQRMADMSGGIERVNLAGIWADLPERPQLINLAPWLLLLAITAFLLEVLERRTALVSIFFRGAGIRIETRRVKRTKAPKAKRKTERAKQTEPPAKPELNSEPETTQTSNLGDALKKARERAEDRHR